MAMGRRHSVRLALILSHRVHPVKRIALYSVLPLDSTFRKILIGDKFGFLSLLTLDTRPSLTLIPIGEVKIILSPCVIYILRMFTGFPAYDLDAFSLSNVLRWFALGQLPTRSSPTSTNSLFRGRYFTYPV